MGSSSSSYNYSATSYNNTPVTQEGENPLALSSASGNQVGGTGNVNGSLNASQTLAAGASINNLDGGAIKSAFDFGTGAITALANLTKDFNTTSSAQNSANLAFADKQVTNTAAQVAASDKQAVSELLSVKALIGMGLIVAVYMYFKKG